MNMLFRPTRPDGRSYRDVAIDALKDRPPESLVTYEELAAALDLDPSADVSKIRSIVRAAIKPLLDLHRRGLSNVPGKGYRILPARENMVVASGHRSKADRAMGRAVAFLQGANRDEMTETERRLHDGQLMIMQAIHASHQHLDKRMNKIEALLQGGKTIEPD